MLCSVLLLPSCKNSDSVLLCYSLLVLGFPEHNCFLSQCACILNHDLYVHVHDCLVMSCSYCLYMPSLSICWSFLLDIWSCTYFTAESGVVLCMLQFMSLLCLSLLFIVCRMCYLVSITAHCDCVICPGPPFFSLDSSCRPCEDINALSLRVSMFFMSFDHLTLNIL